MKNNLCHEVTVQKGHHLEFECQECQHAVRFSPFELERQHNLVSCSHCEKQYSFSDETLKRQLCKFEALCRQIRDAEEILSNTAVGIDIGEHSVKVPYKLLLTRLCSTLSLMLGDQPIDITFRLEPLRDLSPA